MKVLVFCAHADDEVIGLGGTLRKFANAGADIRLVMFSEGAEGYSDLREKDTIINTRQAETMEVCKLLGISEYENLHGLDWGLSVNNGYYHQVIKNIRAFKPDVVFTHACLDYNDHQAVSRVTTEGWFHAALPCAMEETGVWPLVPLYEFEVIQTIPTPSLVVDITDTFAIKQQAMAIYGSQTGIVGGAAQLIEGRALLRGQAVGVKYGEAFTRSNYRPRSIRNIKDLLESTK